MERPTHASVEALRSALQTLEEQSRLAPDDLVLQELKRILLMRIAAVEALELTGSVDPMAKLAALDVAPSPADEPAVAVAIDLAISLIANHLDASPAEPTTPSESDTQTEEAPLRRRTGSAA